MKTLNLEDQKAMDALLKMIGQSLIGTMKFIDAKEFIECKFIDDKTNEEYELKFKRLK